jgi:hypothetical protein
VAISYPTSLDAFSNPSSTDALNNGTTPHATQHANANDALEALEAKVGIGASTPVTNSVLAGTSAGVSGWSTGPTLTSVTTTTTVNAGTHLTAGNAATSKWHVYDYGSGNLQERVNVNNSDTLENASNTGLILQWDAGSSSGKWVWYSKDGVGAVTERARLTNAGVFTALSNVISTGGYLQVSEMTAPSGATDAARIYAVIDGGSKTDLAAIFQSGVTQIFAQEP